MTHDNLGAKLKLVGGLTASEKYEFVHWDDDIPNCMGK